MRDSITLLLDGAATPVTNLFDDCGDDVETWDEASTFVAGPLPGGGWLAAATVDYRTKKLD